MVTVLLVLLRHSFFPQSSFLVAVFVESYAASSSGGGTTRTPSVNKDLVHPGVWKFRGHPIFFEETKKVFSCDDTKDSEQIRNDSPVEKDNNDEAVLLLNGFGVGSFHQHRLINQIFANESVGSKRKIYCIDYLGQGKSWPENCRDGTSENEQNLRYSGETWCDQIVGFLEEIVQEKKVHIVGNSLGGHLAVFVAARCPHRIETISLLNATPVWGLNLPGWSGHLPAPYLPKRIGRYLFDRIRDMDTIEKYLDTAYHNRAAFDDALMSQIRSCTEGDGGHAAFASILWSPPLNFEGDNFYETLTKLQADVLLLFGEEDPWCKPAFAKQMLEYLAKRRLGLSSRYVQLSCVGHCPNHEAPRATSDLLLKWWESTDRANDPLLETSQEEFSESWGITRATERRSQDIPLSLVDRLATTFV